MTQSHPDTALNGICPYFTMFPLGFPYNILSKNAVKGGLVVDPFCGRGTTNYAARLLGLSSIGIDSSPVASALSQAKIANTTPKRIVYAAKRILEDTKEPSVFPEGDFWELAYHPETLYNLCLLREDLMKNCTSDTRKALRAIVMGALHGPVGKTKQSYFSNQCQRTYAPKPNYAVRYWRQKNLIPAKVDVLKIIEERAERYYNNQHDIGGSFVVLGDSRDKKVFSTLPFIKKASWVITSPPYYGMRTYLPDQWLRLWFLGGKSDVEYSNKNQVAHSSPEVFSEELNKVWKNVGDICNLGARMVVRFGGINDRKVESPPILKQSLLNTGWRLQTRKSAGDASVGRRQALHFANTSTKSREEHDFWAIWEGL